MNTRFNDKPLYYFAVVAKEGGISRAAENLDMAVQRLRVCDGVWEQVSQVLQLGRFGPWQSAARQNPHGNQVERKQEKS